jgi:uncharacterized protein (TIGR02266 family)
MVENSRKDPRAKVLSMTVRYKSATLDEFIEHHSHDVSRGGMYIKTPQPFPPGTLLKFEVKIGADQKLMQGVGRVVWRRQGDEATESHPSGMGVKFIKLDDESKALIGQLVAARPGQTSAFDEVALSSDLPPRGISEPPLQAVPAPVGNFFPTSDDDDVAPPAPEDRTVMKQAAELLQEALREVGTSTPDSAPPTAKRDSEISKAERNGASMPGHGSSGNLPALKASPADTASPWKSRVAATSDANEPSTVPPARAAVAATARDAEPRTRPAQPTGKDGKNAPAARAGTNSFGSAAKREHQEEPSTTMPAAAAQQRPARKSGSGGGLRPLIMLLIVAGVAALVFVITRKSEPPASTELVASASAAAAEPAPTPANTTSPDLSAAEIANAAPSAQPSASTSALAAESATPPVANSAAPTAAVSAAPTAAVSAAPTAAETPAKQKSRVRAVAAPTQKKNASGAAPKTAEPAETPTDTVAPKSGASESTKPTSDSPATKGAGATAPATAPPAPAPAPAHDDSPL